MELRARRAMAAMALADPEHDESVWIHLVGTSVTTAMDYGRTLNALSAVMAEIDHGVSSGNELFTELRAHLVSEVIPAEVLDLIGYDR
jgi:hypothetical protein